MSPIQWIVSMEGEDMSFSDCERDSKYCCVLLAINLVAENAHNILAVKEKESTWGCGEYSTGVL